MDKSEEETSNTATEEIDYDRPESETDPYRLNATRLCCSLGTLAGEKGFHCNVNFYLSRYMIDRNKNRAHNRQLPFHGRDRVDDFGRASMSRFGHCIVGAGPKGARVFHSCCSIAAIRHVQEEREERRQEQGAWDQMDRIISIMDESRQDQEN